jgi:two-component system sensor histidine kinase KdpD
MERSNPEQLLREYGEHARLVVYLAAAPGAGKTRRLLTDARRLRAAGKRVFIGWVETKDRPDLERLTDGLPVIPPREVALSGQRFFEFDLDAALAAKPDAIVLDELAHDNLGEFGNAKRWQDAIALRDAGISVLCAFNIAHLETVSPTAEALLGYPVRDIIPLSFLKTADEVIAIDASPDLIVDRLRAGKIVRAEDIARAEAGAFKASTLTMMRELLLRTIDDLTIPIVAAASVSNAVAIVPPGIDTHNFLERGAPIATAFDLLLEILPLPGADRAEIERAARQHNADILPSVEEKHLDAAELRASMLVTTNGELAKKLVSTSVTRDIAIIDAEQSFLEKTVFTTPLSATLGDRMRVGYGKLTVYLGAAAGAGKTYAMLDRGQQLKADGVDVVIGLVETHKRPETEAMIDDLEIVPRKQVTLDGMTYSEMDRDAVLARRPQVALVDELAHTNAPGSLAEKRYLDVLAFLRAGINVLTTLNVQHLEALNDVVYRMTGTVVRETLPDGILPLADEVILIDVSPDTLRERLRAGKIYPRERIDAALSHFFRAENLASLRELAIREALRAETRERISAPFRRLLVSVIARPEDLLLIRRAGRLAARLEVDFAIAHVAEPRDRPDPDALAELARIARAGNAEWIDERAGDAPRRLLEIARAVPETVVCVGGTHRAPRWPARKAFARRLLDAGARELIVLVRPVTAQERQALDSD